MTASPAAPSDHGLREAFPATLLIALAALAAVAPFVLRNVLGMGAVAYTAVFGLCGPTATVTIAVAASRVRRFSQARQVRVGRRRRHRGRRRHRQHPRGLRPAREGREGEPGRPGGRAPTAPPGAVRTRARQCPLVDASELVLVAAAAQGAWRSRVVGRGSSMLPTRSTDLAMLVADRSSIALATMTRSRWISRILTRAQVSLPVCGSSS